MSQAKYVMKVPKLEWMVILERNRFTSSFYYSKQTIFFARVYLINFFRSSHRLRSYLREWKQKLKYATISKNFESILLHALNPLSLSQWSGELVTASHRSGVTEREKHFSLRWLLARTVIWGWRPSPMLRLGWRFSAHPAEQLWQGASLCGALQQGVCLRRPPLPERVLRRCGALRYSGTLVCGEFVCAGVTSLQFTSALSCISNLKNNLSTTGREIELAFWGTWKQVLDKQI